MEQPWNKCLESLDNNKTIFCCSKSLVRIFQFSISEKVRQLWFVDAGHRQG